MATAGLNVPVEGALLCAGATANDKGPLATVAPVHRALPGRVLKGSLQQERWVESVQQRSQQRSRTSVRALPTISATAAVQTKPTYDLPTWAKFEMGQHPVFWETATGSAPTSGELLTIYFNPAATGTSSNPDYGFAFNGGFNQPIMCGGEPRQMTRKDRGPNCSPFYIIKINVPVHAVSLEFSFTNGVDWVGPYFITMEVPRPIQGQPMSFYNEGLAKELSADGACEDAIYPDAAYIQDRCLMPFSAAQFSGASCELDLVPGCTDTSSPYYDPFATIDDGSCKFDAE